MDKYILEFTGTFFLVLVIGLTANPIAIGAVLVALVYMGGYVSGAHYNPAVTLGIWMQGKIEAKQAGRYVLAQLLAAIAAAGVYQAIVGDKIIVAPNADMSFMAALLVEFLFTFALVSVVLHTAVSKQAVGNNYYGIAIGLTVMAAAFAGGAISGGAFNPAVGLGPNLYDISTLSSHMSNIWLYLVGPLAGGAVASIVFNQTAPRTTQV